MLTRHRRVAICLLAIAMLLTMVGRAPAKGYDPAHAAKRADGNPFRCKQHARVWTRLSNECVVRVVYRKHPRLLREVLEVIPCESGWNNYDGPAWGLTQFIQSTARTWSQFLWDHYKSYRIQMRRYGYDLKRMFQHPVWNARASLSLRLSAKRWSGPWLASKACHGLR